MANNSFIAPLRGWRGTVLESLANCARFRRLRRAVMGRLPFMKMASDVQDIVYASWVVPVPAVAALIPPGVKVWERDGQTIFTVLTYRHGHFGPDLGLFRRVFPSPLQSNWRLYVAELEGSVPTRPTVLFLKNTFDQALHTLGTRLFSDIMASHFAKPFVHQRDGSVWESRIEEGGSAPGIRLSAREVTAGVLPAEFHGFFATWADAVGALCLQDGAIAMVEDADCIAEALIDLPIEVQAVQPLEALTYLPGYWLRSLGVSGLPFCFRVPSVHFRVRSERLRASAS